MGVKWQVHYGDPVYDWSNMDSRFEVELTGQQAESVDQCVTVTAIEDQPRDRVEVVHKTTEGTTQYNFRKHAEYPSMVVFEYGGVGEEPVPDAVTNALFASGTPPENVDTLDNWFIRWFAFRELRARLAQVIPDKTDQIIEGILKDIGRQLYTADELAGIRYLLESGDRYEHIIENTSRYTVGEAVNDTDVPGPDRSDSAEPLRNAVVDTQSRPYVEQVSNDVISESATELFHPEGFQSPPTVVETMEVAGEDRWVAYLLTPYGCEAFFFATNGSNEKVNYQPRSGQVSAPPLRVLIELNRRGVELVDLPNPGIKSASGVVGAAIEVMDRYAKGGNWRAEENDSQEENTVEDHTLGLATISLSQLLIALLAKDTDPGGYNTVLEQNGPHTVEDPELARKSIHAVVDRMSSQHKEQLASRLEKSPFLCEFTGVADGHRSMREIVNNIGVLF